MTGVRLTRAKTKQTWLCCWFIELSVPPPTAVAELHARCEGPTRYTALFPSTFTHRYQTVCPLKAKICAFTLHHTGWHGLSCFQGTLCLRLLPVIHLWCMSHHFRAAPSSPHHTRATTGPLPQRPHGGSQCPAAPFFPISPPDPPGRCIQPPSLHPCPPPSAAPQRQGGQGGRKRRHRKPRAPPPAEAGRAARWRRRRSGSCRRGTAAPCARRGSPRPRSRRLPRPRRCWSSPRRATRWWGCPSWPSRASSASCPTTRPASSAW